MGNARQSILITSIVALGVAAGCSRPLPPEPPPAPPAPIAGIPEVVIAENLPIEPEVPEVPEAQSEDASASAPEEADPGEDEGTKDPFNSETVDENREGRHILERALMDPKRDP